MKAKKLSERQSQIVDAALRIIATKGSRRFTTQLLAKEVGLTSGALYRHFAAMDEVVDAIIDRVGEVLFEGFPPEAADPIERLRLFFHRRARTMLGSPDVLRLLLSDHLAQAGSSAQTKRLGEFRRRSRAFVVECLKEASARGALADGMRPEAAVVVVLGSILALSHGAPRVVNGEGGEQLINEVWSGIERMLRRSLTDRAEPTPKVQNQEGAHESQRRLDARTQRGPDRARDPG